MRVTREQAQQNRQRVVEVAAKLFRERGIGGIGLAELMKAAGLTHGGFYGQFESKDDLVAHAAGLAMEESRATWLDAAARSHEDPLAAMVAAYVSTSHRDNKGGGCAIPSLGAEVARGAPEARHTLTQGIERMLDLLEEAAPGDTAMERREAAMAALASMVGAIVLSRAVDSEKLSKQVLRAVRAQWGAPA
jgi:TetR/AcrR family transcriptional regulator, transcriptional repressor for nem operon